MTEGKAPEKEETSQIPQEEMKSEQSTASATCPQEPQLKKIENLMENQIFSEKCVLYKKEDGKWIEKSIGTLLGKKIEGKGVQILFSMENTRNILNVLVNRKSSIQRNKTNIMLAGIHEGETGIFCLAFKNEDNPAKIVDEVHSHCLE
ncbi:hypothetical protein NEFER03_1183 [Nematocida sp. LUAm3]|nr:hypothetical protein NEFER03_1183 [Nematocida sp. LUAm3]KAI5175792.1 hypothetical protein NEFER02_1661 [Nematocida sp. LUAm2]KAI5178288.1 hypothetical protein NEFER01_1455 [Nematocida sp. LUAm1]